MDRNFGFQGGRPLSSRRLGLMLLEGECRDRGIAGSVGPDTQSQNTMQEGEGVMGTRWIALVVVFAVALSASAVFAQCGCATVAVAPTVTYYSPAPTVTYYSPAPYVSYYAPAAPYVTYYSAPYVTYYAAPAWRVYARPRFYAYRPVLIW